MNKNLFHAPEPLLTTDDRERALVQLVPKFLYLQQPLRFYSGRTYISVFAMRLEIKTIEPALGQEFRVSSLEPIHFKVDVELTIPSVEWLAQQQVKVEIWTNLQTAETVGAVNEWTSIPLQCIQVRHSSNDKVQAVYAISVIPIQSGCFEVTARGTLLPRDTTWAPNKQMHYSTSFRQVVKTMLLMQNQPKSTWRRVNKDILYTIIEYLAPEPQASDWQWAGGYNYNSRVVVEEQPQMRLAPESLDFFVQNFQTLMREQQATDQMMLNKPPTFKPGFGSKAYVVAMLCTVLRDQGLEQLEVVQILRDLLMEMDWMERKTNRNRLMSFLCRSNRLAVSILNSAERYLPLPQTMQPMDSTTASKTKELFPTLIAMVQKMIREHEKKTPDITFVAFLECIIRLAKAVPGDLISKRVPFDLVQLLIATDSDVEHVFTYRLLKVFASKPGRDGYLLFLNVLQACEGAILMSSHNDVSAISSVLDFSLDTFVPGIKDDQHVHEHISKRQILPAAHLVSVVVREMLSSRSPVKCEVMADFLIRAAGTDYEVATETMREVLSSDWSYASASAHEWLLEVLERVIFQLDTFHLHKALCQKKFHGRFALIRRLNSSIASLHHSVSLKGLKAYGSLHFKLEKIADLDSIHQTLRQNADTHWSSSIRQESLLLEQQCFPTLVLS